MLKYVLQHRVKLYNMDGFMHKVENGGGGEGGSWPHAEK